MAPGRKVKLYIAALALPYSTLAVWLLYVWLAPYSFYLFEGPIGNKKVPFHKPEYVTYLAYDFNKDGYSEIYKRWNEPGDFKINQVNPVIRQGDRQFNFDGPIVTKEITFGYLPSTSNSYPFIDLNGDNHDEMIVFSKTDDSLFINILDFKNYDYIAQRHFVLKRKRVVTEEKAGTIKEKWDIGIEDAVFFDADNDGDKELVFLLNAAKAEWPRGLFVYDLERMEIADSILTGCKLRKLDLADFGDDGSQDYIISTIATQNINRPYFLSDSFAYFLAIDKDTQVIKAEKLAFHPGSVWSVPFSFNGSTYFLATISGQTRDTSDGILLINNRGEIVDRMPIETATSEIFIWPDTEPSFILSSNGNIVLGKIYNGNTLKITKTIVMEIRNIRLILPFEIEDSPVFLVKSQKVCKKQKGYAAIS